MSTMKRYRQPIKFIATLLTTVYGLCLLKVFSGSAPPLSFLPAQLRELDMLIYLGAIPLLLMWVLVVRFTHLSEEERILMALAAERRESKKAVDKRGER
jgi:hypothetical protein